MNKYFKYFRQAELSLAASLVVRKPTYMERVKAGMSRPSRQISRGRAFMRTLILLLLLPLVASCASKYALDADVKRLCAIDGGTKVYQTVALPPEKFDERGQFINFFRPTREENALGPEYLFSGNKHYYRKGNPEMSRFHYQIFRRSDGKLLGETIVYVRGGGDMFYGPSRGSGFRCPPDEEAGVNVLIKKIFILSEDGE